jgi:hypothetical protein
LFALDFGDIKTFLKFRDWRVWLNNTFDTPAPDRFDCDIFPGLTPLADASDTLFVAKY